jgi:small subunit ribosomal protein S14
MRQEKDMAKTSSIEKNKRRQRLVQRYKNKRSALKAVLQDRSKPTDERFAAQIKLAELPRNSSKTRVRNRCALTGRARGYYRKLKLCRNQLRELASQGLIPGMTKSSW